jgi:hypothetical protein
VPGRSRPSKRDEILKHTGQRLYPVIEFDDGTWYREESKDMEQTIRDGKLTGRDALPQRDGLESGTEGVRPVRIRLNKLAPVCRSAS